MMQTELQRDICLAQDIAREVCRQGGRAYYVGGFVRDRVLGRESKDVDIEIHGLSAAASAELLAGFGRVEEHGASFGILQVRGYGVDIYVFVGDGVRESALRRDLTINALYEDILTGEIVDCFGGAADLERGVLRYVDADTFGEDPLRVLRVAQFAARFGMRADESTKALCRQIDLSGVACERVLEELRKTLLKSAAPSVAFELLCEMGQLSPWFCEIESLRGVPQNPVYHPEGDVWAHTMLVLDAAAELREQASDPFDFMLAALVHDVGKPQTTRTLEDGRLVAYGHEAAGVPVAKAFLRRLGVRNKTESYVLNMVELHMAPLSLARQGARQKSYNKLFDQSVCPRDLLLLAFADARGRVGATLDEATRSELEDRLAAFEELMALPCVQGRDLIELGVEPGPLMGEVLKYAHKLRLSMVNKERALQQCAGFYRKLKADEAKQLG
ncbi:MAG: HD domain-containing protein [Coriobacteriales bacterium]|nr:HD domain-containing protein [Coriobacteriales bacterium]